MPSDDVMTAYAEKLDAIYRDIAAAFPSIEPGRKAGYGLAFQTLAMHFANTGKGYSLEDVQAACKQLAHGSFIEIKNGIFAHPTDLGEQLIAAVTRKPRASTPSLPPLPAHTW